MSTKRISKKDFVAWLKTTRVKAVPGSGCQCVLAKYLESRGRQGPAVGYTRWYTRTGEPRETTYWMRAVVRAFDRIGARPGMPVAREPLAAKVYRPIVLEALEA